MARARIDQHVHTEWRGSTCRVKWWSGEYLPNGRKRYESKGGFTDEAEAYQYGQDKLYEIRHGTHVKNRDGATLLTEWADSWMESVDLKATSERNYRSAIRKHIKPYFKGWSISDVDVLAYRLFKKHVHASVQASSAKVIMNVFNMILDDAVPRLIKSSPVERSRRRGAYTKKPRERKREIPMQEVEALARNLELLIGRKGYVFIWTMAMTGMRPAELFGLRREYCFPYWPASDPRDDGDDARYEDDLKRYGSGEEVMPAIRVQHQVQNAGGRLALCPPKYDSYRTLVVPRFLAGMLKELLESHDSAWVFPSSIGTSLGGVDFNARWWRPAADGAEAHKKLRKPDPRVKEVPGWRKKRLYLLRHLQKAWLDEDGHSRFAVESRMGHEVQGVEGIYSNVTVEMERAIVAALDRRWDAFSTPRRES